MIDYKVSHGTAGNSDIPPRYEDLPSHNIEVFQSENIQNILDAKSKQHNCVEIQYIIEKLSPQGISTYKNLLGKEYFERLVESFKKCGSQDIADQVAKVKLALKNEDKWYSLTIIEKNTIGLQGDETGQEPGSNYNALMRHSNRSEKEGISGGTFGKGSSVYTYCSGLWLWFAYSVLEKKWNDTKVRFIGRGMVAPYIDFDGNKSYDGPLWYSRKETEKDYVGGYPQQGLPFINNLAHEEAKKFNISQRLDNDPGTTYLIPVFWPDGIGEKDISEELLIRDLKNEILKRWFIPIYNGILKCSISSTTGNFNQSIEKEDLKLIPELTHKLDILDWYYNENSTSKKGFHVGKIEIKSPILKKDQQIKIKTKYGKSIGSKQTKAILDLIVKELPEEENSFTGFTDEDGTGTTCRVALTRNKGMIVNHYPYDPKIYQDLVSSSNGKKFEAILFAGKMCQVAQNEESIDHLELFLSYAENPAHNEWINQKQNLHRCNLKRFDENQIPFPTNRINSIFTKIFSLISEFFPKDDIPPAKKDICSFWKKLYRLPFAGDTSTGIQNFSYEIISEGYDSGGHYSWKFNFYSRIRDNSIELTFVPYLNSLKGDIDSINDFDLLGISEYINLFRQSYPNVALFPVCARENTGLMTAFESLQFE